jgi:membrane protein implicated in regulation of membrane protease activity
VWSARSVNDDMKIPVGQHVVVQKIEGVKLIVSFDSKNDTAAP